MLFSLLQQEEIRVLRAYNYQGGYTDLTPDPGPGIAKRPQEALTAAEALLRAGYALLALDATALHDSEARYEPAFDCLQLARDLTKHAPSDWPLAPRAGIVRLVAQVPFAGRLQTPLIPEAFASAYACDDATVQIQAALTTAAAQVQAVAGREEINGSASLAFRGAARNAIEAARLAGEAAQAAAKTGIYAPQRAVYDSGFPWLPESGPLGVADIRDSLMKAGRLCRTAGASRAFVRAVSQTLDNVEVAFGRGEASRRRPAVDLAV